MFVGPQVWQDVPNEIKNYSKHTFKKACTKVLLQSHKKKIRKKEYKHVWIQLYLTIAL